MRILTVCGAGVGSSMMLKLFTDQILQAEGIDAEVNAVDIGSVSDQDVDIIVTTPDMAKLLRTSEAKVIELTNLMDKTTLKNELLAIINQ